MVRATLLAAAAQASLVLASPTLIKKQNALIPVTQSFYDTIVYYGNFAAAAMSAPCMVPPHNSVAIKYINNVLTSTQATLFRVDATKQLIFSLRGSSDVIDFLTDFNEIPAPYPGCAGCTVHSGFYYSWQSVRTESLAAVDAALAANPGYSVAITGHSLGGALSNLVWTDMVSSGKYPSLHNGWSYGEPRVGNPAYANYVDSLSGATDDIIGAYTRVTHFNDGVPQLPSQGTIPSYRHHRSEVWASADAYSAGTTYICQGQENPNCNDGAGGIFINEAHINYPGIDYTKACTAAQ